MKRFPRNAARVGDPVLVRARVTARLLILLDHTLVGGLDLPLHPKQLLVPLELEAQVGYSGLLMMGRDREVHSWVLQHPFRVVRFEDRRLAAEESGIEPDALVQVGNRHVYVKALHEVFLLRLGMATGTQL